MYLHCTAFKLDLCDEHGLPRYWLWFDRKFVCSCGTSFLPYVLPLKSEQFVPGVVIFKYTSYPCNLSKDVALKFMSGKISFSASPVYLCTMADGSVQPIDENPFEEVHVLHNSTTKRFLHQLFSVQEHRHF